MTRGAGNVPLSYLLTGHLPIVRPMTWDFLQAHRVDLRARRRRGQLLPAPLALPPPPAAPPCCRNFAKPNRPDPVVLSIKQESTASSPPRPAHWCTSPPAHQSPPRALLRQSPHQSPVGLVQIFNLEISSRGWHHLALLLILGDHGNMSFAPFYITHGQLSQGSLATKV